MIRKPPDHDNRDDHDLDNGDNDNGKPKGQAVAPAPAGGALASLAALGAALNNVDTSSVTGRSGTPMLQFKSRESGIWVFGQKRTIVEDGSRWAANPLTFRWGYICFSNDNKVVGERIVAVSQPKPEVATLPDKGFEWQEQWTVGVKCIDGTDAGTEAIYKPTTVGGIQAVASLIDAVRDRLNGGQHDGKVAPIVILDKDSYPHPQHGRIWTPVLTIVGWMPLDGPAPTPAPEPAPPPKSPAAATAASEQPRRRRVA